MTERQIACAIKKNGFKKNKEGDYVNGEVMLSWDTEYFYLGIYTTKWHEKRKVHYGEPAIERITKELSGMVTNPPLSGGLPDDLIDLIADADIAIWDMNNIRCIWDEEYSIRWFESQHNQNFIYILVKDGKYVSHHVLNYDNDSLKHDSISDIKNKSLRTASDRFRTEVEFNTTCIHHGYSLDDRTKSTKHGIYTISIVNGRLMVEFKLHRDNITMPAANNNSLYEVEDKLRKAFYTSLTKHINEKD